MKLSRIAGLAIGLAACAAAAPASAAQKPYIPTGAADTSLNVSPWAKANDATATCTGVGPSRRDINKRTLYASFRCAVKVGAGEPGGVVLVTATGPESVRVARVESGQLSGDVAIGAIPRGRPLLRSIDVTSLLGRSAWGRGKQLFGVLCAGVGPYRDTENALLFSAFVCKARVLSSEPAILLVQATGRSAVRVARTLA